MGHNLLPIIPTSARWRQVVGLVADDGSAQDVAAAAARAAEREFSRAAGDPVFIDCVRLLAALPGAASGRDVAGAFQSIGLQAGSSPSLPDLLGAVSARLDAVAREAGGSSDFGELCRRALVATLACRIADGLPGLLTPERQDVVHALGALDRPEAFAATARQFFGRLVSETLANWLGRILPTQVGPGARFEDLGARADFDRALAAHITETTRIIQEFSVGWHAKTLRGEADLTPDRARRFGGYAFTKIRAELARRSGDDG